MKIVLNWYLIWLKPNFFREIKDLEESCQNVKFWRKKNKSALYKISRSIPLTTNHFLLISKQLIYLSWINWNSPLSDRYSFIPDLAFTVFFYSPFCQPHPIFNSQLFSIFSYVPFSGTLHSLAKILTLQVLKTHLQNLCPLVGSSECRCHIGCYAAEWVILLGVLWTCQHEMARNLQKLALKHSMIVTTVPFRNQIFVVHIYRKWTTSWVE